MIKWWLAHICNPDTARAGVHCGFEVSLDYIARPGLKTLRLSFCPTSQAEGLVNPEKLSWRFCWTIIFSCIGITGHPGTGTTSRNNLPAHLVAPRYSSWEVGGGRAKNVSSLQSRKMVCGKLSQLLAKKRSEQGLERWLDG